MSTRSYKRLNPPDYFLWTETEASVRVGETVDVHFECNYTLTESEFSFSDSSKAELSSIQQSSAPQYATFQGNEIGTTTVTVSVFNSTLTLNVIEADDNKFLNKRGLARFWDKIDDKKQDKLTAGSNITINGNTISATQPTVNNATLTIQKNSTNVATFTANAASNVTANISVPTATSDLTNDSGFIASITKITNAEIDTIMGVS